MSSSTARRAGIAPGRTTDHTTPDGDDMTDPTTDTARTSVVYDAIDAFQRTHRLPGLAHAQIRGLLAEHLARVLPITEPAAVPPVDRAAVARVRAVLETEAVVGRSALDYRGLIAAALMADEPPSAAEPPLHGESVAHIAGCEGAEARQEIVHGCPPDGSGLTPCCGRTPFELPLGDRISSEAPVTCRGGQ